MPKIRRSKRIQTKKVSKPKQPESLTKNVQNYEFEVKASAACKSETESESYQEKTQACFACTQKHPHIRRYPKTHWIQCDNCDEWWHLECACVSLEDSVKYGHYKISYSCALCVLRGSPWVKSNHLISDIIDTKEQKQKIVSNTSTETYSSESPSNTPT